MVNICDVKQGDIVYENEYGFSDEYRAITDAKREDGGWAFDAVDTVTNATVHFYVRDGYEWTVTLDSYPHYQKMVE